MLYCTKSLVPNNRFCVKICKFLGSEHDKAVLTTYQRTGEREPVLKIYPRKSSVGVPLRTYRCGGQGAGMAHQQWRSDTDERSQPYRGVVEECHHRTNHSRQLKQCWAEGAG